MAVGFLDSQFGQISLILIIAAFSIPVARKISIAEVPILIFLGLLFGPILNGINPEFARTLMTGFAGVGVGLLGIVIVLYAEAHKINLKILRKEFSRIASLDTLGILSTLILAALFFKVLTGAPWLVAMLFGSIIAPTDPVTIIPVFRKLRVKEDVYGIVLGESLFNDPVSIIAVTFFIALLVPTSGYSPLFSGFVDFFGLIAGSVTFLLVQIIIPSVLGIGIGFLMIYLNKIFEFENFLLGLLLGVILLEFSVLEFVYITPFPAIIATGAVVGNFSDKSIFWQRESNFSDNLSFLAQSLIFILLGAILTLSDLQKYAVLGGLLALVLIFVARPAAVWLSLRIADLRKRGMRFDSVRSMFISFVGPRGTVTVVLSTLPTVIGLQTGNQLLIHWGSIIYSATAVVVVASIVFVAIFIPSLAKTMFPQEVNTQQNS